MAPRFRIVGALALATALASPADAQIMRIPQRTNEPSAWASASAGLLQPGQVVDGRTQSRWVFGSALQYRASLERGISNQSAIGVVGTWAPNAPLTYVNDAAGTASDARASIRSIGAFFHAGGGLGLFQVLEVSVGVTNYGSFRRSDTGAPLPPVGGDTDFSFGIGYGFGYALSARSQIMLVQDAAQVLHQGDGLSGSARRNVAQYTTRVGLRIGAGQRRR